MTWPFTFEAMGMCICAVGTYLWTEMLIDSRNLVWAAFHAWMILFSFVAMFLFAVRWVELP